MSDLSGVELVHQLPHLSGIEAIGERVRCVRGALGWTQMELAELLPGDVTQGHIHKIESGRSLRPRGIEHLARTLSVNPAWLQFGYPFARRERPPESFLTQRT